MVVLRMGGMTGIKVMAAPVPSSSLKRHNLLEIDKMLVELNKQKPEFIVRDGVIRLLETKVLSGKDDLLLINQNDSRKDALMEDFPQREYQAAEGLTAEMLTYLPGEEVLDFDICSQEHLAMVIQKWCESKKQPTVQPVDSHYEEFLREEKLAELQKACQNAIDEGVEVATSEGTKRFSLTMQDQINLLRLQNLLDKGCEAIPYHADGEAIWHWSCEDVQNILHEADCHIANHVYFSLLLTPYFPVF